MANWEGKFVKCPFYRTNDTNRIVCEGLADKNTINLVYESQTDRKDYMRAKCNDIEGCRTCHIYRLLYKLYE
jgi:hypothetical protein